jgi:hypothetical protein
VASLKRLTNHLQPESFIKVMSFAQNFVAGVLFDNYSSAQMQIEKCNAFDDPADDKRLLLPSMSP